MLHWGCKQALKALETANALLLAENARLMRVIDQRDAKLTEMHQLGYEGMRDSQRLNFEKQQAEHEFAIAEMKARGKDSAAIDRIFAGEPDEGEGEGDGAPKPPDSEQFHTGVVQ